MACGTKATARVCKIISVFAGALGKINGGEPFEQRLIVCIHRDIAEDEPLQRSSPWLELTSANKCKAAY
jgi:hypothetical protein